MPKLDKCAISQYENSVITKQVPCREKIPPKITTRPIDVNRWRQKKATPILAFDNGRPNRDHVHRRSTFLKAYKLYSHLLFSLTLIHL